MDRVALVVIVGVRVLVDLAIAVKPGTLALVPLVLVLVPKSSPYPVRLGIFTRLQRFLERSNSSAKRLRMENYLQK